jgi:hypothetical protein
MRESRHPSVEAVENQRHKNRERRLVEVPVHGLHDRKEARKQRDGRE